MTAVKVHTMRGLKAYYLKRGRNWIVEENDQKNVFDCLESMIESYPDLLEVPAILMSSERRKQPKFRPVKTENKALSRRQVMNVRTEKLVSCYYCSGKGDLFQGVPCPNCHGKKDILVTTIGLG